MKRIWFFVFSFVCLYNCENSKSKSSNPLTLVPKSADVVIKVNSTEGLVSTIKNNDVIQATKSFAKVKDFNRLLAPLHHINGNSGLLTLSKEKNDSLDVCFIIPFLKEITSIDSIPGLEIDSTFKDKNDIRKITFGTQNFYSKKIAQFLFISNRLSLTQNAKHQYDLPQELQDLNSISDTETTASFVINHSNKHFKPLIFLDSTLNSYQFSNYTVINSDISQHSIYLNGITKATDSVNSLINVFKTTIPQENKVASILPNDVDYFKSITFNNYNTFKQNLIRHTLLDSVSNTNHVFQSIVEVSQAKLDQEDLFILRSIDPVSTQEDLNMPNIEDKFRSVPIYELDQQDESLLNTFNPFIAGLSATHFITISDFFIFSKHLPTLEKIISNYQNKTVLAKSDAYKQLQLDLSDEASLLIYGNDKTLNTVLNSNFTDDINLNSSDFKTSAIQFIYDTNFAHVNAVFKTHNGTKSSNSISEEFNISIDADLMSEPQLVRNHTNSQMDLAVQDINNNLYLISNKGQVFWKKQLDGKILGNIEQIDTYKNGRLQLVFNTSKRLYVLDRKGNNVNAFPLKFEDAITQPVSVFDYDSNKNYRLLITQRNSISLYDKNGKIVNGFNYKPTPNSITTQPKHFRINRKDYIVFASGNKMEILNRIGKTRIKVKEDISFSENEIYLYNNRFTTSNTNGELLEINLSGTVNHKNLNVNSDHKMATTSKTLVVLNDNKLSIKSNTFELDFGNYTSPKLFYINDKIFVTVTDLQSKKGYLFDSQAKPFANFPVYANSELELNNIDKDNALEIVTKGDANSIIVYEIKY